MIERKGWKPRSQQFKPVCPAASSSAGSLGVQELMNPEILKTAKLWRFQKLSRDQHDDEDVSLVADMLTQQGCLQGQRTNTACAQHSKSANEGGKASRIA
ncbi:hypothetical protein WJX77_007291 [Trebouxia sp. C0004]